MGKSTHDFGKGDAKAACEDCGLSRDLALRVPAEIKQPCDKRLAEGFAAGYERGFAAARQMAERIPA